MKPIFFAGPAEFRHWLEANHACKPEVLVGYYKRDTGRPSLTWSQSVDEALCFGWIDGIRRRIDDERYCIRFTPRRKTSIWSRRDPAAAAGNGARGFRPAQAPCCIAAPGRKAQPRSRAMSSESPPDLSEPGGRAIARLSR